MDVGVIGVGIMGQNHARVYSELKAVDSVWVYDLNEAAAKNIADKNSAECAGSMDELLKSVDAVSLCVPTPYHCSTAKEVIRAGVNVLIEKPICLTSAEAEELIQMIPEDLTVGVGHIERFNPIISEIKEIIKDPLYVEIKRHNPASARVTGSSVVEDLMIHDIDIVFHSLFENGCEYKMESLCTFDVCGALFQFEKTPVYLSASRKSSKKIRMIHIEEEEFTIQGDFMSQEVYVYRKPEHYHVEEQRYVQENIIEKVMVGKVEPLKTELNTFIDCVKTGEPFPVTPEQAMKNVKICESITKQSL
ncbi:MAG: Gfo/Idh/MocA family oxidoreductase [Methanogenium sp.]|nr:Gfo/Idh/MocA family oxidoreductase [Methanogenium sp.]